MIFPKTEKQDRLEGNIPAFKGKRRQVESENNMFESDNDASWREEEEEEEAVEVALVTCKKHSRMITKRLLLRFCFEKTNQCQLVTD